MQLVFEQEKNMKAGGYTFLVLSIVMALLFIITWKPALQQEPLLNEGIEVNIGNSETGLGDIPPMVPGEPSPEAAEAIAAAPPANPPAPEPVNTDEESEAADAVDLPKKPPVTAAKPRPATNQNAPVTKPAVAPPAAPAPKPKAQMGTYTGGKGTGGNNQDAFNNVRNQGVAGGTGDQGKPNGNINSDNYTGNGGTGNSGSFTASGFSGRRPVRFPSFEEDFNEAGNIAMVLKIDENGKVISASFSATGSTSSNSRLKEIARKKALELKFNPGDNEDVGTVVFKFRLKD